MTIDDIIRYYHQGITERGGCGGPVMFVCMLLAWILCGCSTQYVPVREVHTEYRNTTDTVHTVDTVVHERRTVVREANSGDSALLARYGIQLRDNERLLLFLQSELQKERTDRREAVRDTVFVRDSVPAPFPVEKQLTAWQKAKVDFGGWAVLAVIGFLGFRLIIPRLRR